MLKKTSKFLSCCFFFMMFLQLALAAENLESKEKGKKKNNRTPSSVDTKTDSSSTAVVAIVEDQKILKSELEQTFLQNQLFLSSEAVTKDKTLNDLINRRLGIIKAYKTKLNKDEVVLRKVEDVLYHAQISKDLEPLFKEIKVSDEDVKNYYEQNQEYRTAQILFRLRANPSHEELKAALNQAIEVYEIIKKDPDKFSNLANKHSQSDTAPTGGDMGFQPRTRLAPEYFKAINGKPENFITPPVQTQFGIHIIKVIGVKKIDQINQDLYKKIVYDAKRDEIIERYFDNSRKNANVKIIKENL